MIYTMQTRTVARTEVRLHVVQSGPPARGDTPSVVFVHGFPDNHETWRPVIEALSDDVAATAYDVRGTGRSSAPFHRSGYRIDRLRDDLVAVLDAVRPDGAPVHLVGHDWGSVQLWGILAARDPRLAGRIASYTSISGPPVEVMARYLGGVLTGPDRRAPLRQLRHSWYIAAFQVPRLPELVFRSFGTALGERIAAREGVRDLFSDTLARDGAHGVNLYRVNRAGGTFDGVDVPVQLIVPRRDAFLTVPLMDFVADAVGPDRRVDLDAGHWVIRTDAARVAAEVEDFARHTGL